jgi:hypothetical protein
MNNETKLTLTGTLAILAFDAISAWLTSIGKFPAAVCFIASVAFYFWAAYRMAIYINVWEALSLGAFFGLVDATLGAKICTWLGGDPHGVFKNLTLNAWWTILFLLMLYGLTISLIAFLVSALRNKRKTF